MVAEDHLKGEPFVMYLGDNLLKQGAKPLIQVFNETESDFVVGAAKVNDPSRYGVVFFNKDGTISKFVEKPKEPISNWALIGLYVFNDKVFNAIKQIKPSWRGELEITDTIQTLLTTGAKVNIQKVKGWWKDTGKPEDLIEANQLILQELTPYNHGTIEKAATITNNVGIGRGTVIHSRTTIRGLAIIGDHCTIGPNTQHRPIHKHRRQHHYPEHRDREQHHNGGHPYRLRQTHHRQPHRETRHNPQPTNRTSPEATGSSSETWPQSPYKHR